MNTDKGNHPILSSNSWDMSQERAFVENLLGQRFNYFLVFFSLIIAGSLTAKKTLHFQLILALGALISWLLAATLYRVQRKLDLILAELLSDTAHPVAIIDSKTNRHLSMRKQIGYVIPTVCCVALTLGAILAFCEILTP